MRNYELRVRGIVTAVLPDAVTREIDIDAPPEVVWSIVTEARHLAGWFSDEAEDRPPAGRRDAAHLARPRRLPRARRDR